MVGRRAVRRGLRRGLAGLLRVTRRKRLQDRRSGELHGSIRRGTGRIRTSIKAIRASVRRRHRRR